MEQSKATSFFEQPSHKHFGPTILSTRGIDSVHRESCNPLRPPLRDRTHVCGKRCAASVSIRG